jgi:glycosyltransferase involved in cell wall biosynthesis
MNKEYLFGFFSSLRKQTYRYFDVIVVNDRYENFEELENEFSSLNIVELAYSGTPAENREYGVNYILEHDYDILIFGDSDDYFDTDRVQVSVDMLNGFDIVVNDITLFDKNGISCQKYISNRVGNNTTIDLDFIKEKNIFGMTNTAVRVNTLRNITFDESLLAVDWYLFSILLSKKYKAIFTNDTETFYRQYTDNTIGLGDITEASILKGIAVKFKHYELMQEENIQYKSLFVEICELKKKIENRKYVEKLKKQNIQNPFWWEWIRDI